MTPADLAAIQARADAATPGPWLTPEEAGDPYQAPALCYEARPDWMTDEEWAEEREARGKVPLLDHEGCLVWPWVHEADMVFAYAARQDVPALLAEVARLQANEAEGRAFFSLYLEDDPPPGGWLAASGLDP